MGSKDFYSKYNNQDLWSIKEDLFEPELQNIRETQFTIGNGFMGLRGVLEELPKDSSPGTFVAGIYDRLTSQVSELVNFPNPLNFKIIAHGEKLGAVEMDIIDHKRILNMKDAVLTRHTVYSDSKGKRYDYQSLRFCSMHNKNLIGMQIVLTPIDEDAEIEIQTGVDTNVFNSGVITEGDKRHFNIEELYQEDNINTIVVETLEKRHKIIYLSGFCYKIGGKKSYVSENILSFNLKKRQTVVFTLFFYISLKEGGDKIEKKDLTSSKNIFNKILCGSFENLLKKHINEWHLLWDKADVIIEGTNDIQKNLRFNIYHMLICGYYDEGFSSIGARTLSGQGYRGHIFWDTEIFLLPFYTYVLPDIAKSLLQYRYNRIDQARSIAKSKGYKGVMFPWESAGIGEEETPTWAKNIDGSIIKIKTNDLEHHITADIAYAFYKYVQITGDTDFMKQYGYELIFETARFWASRVEKNKKGKYEINNVIGPDEFHEHINNNAFTNAIAQWNLLIGYKLYFDLKKDIKLFKSILSKINLSENEAAKWKYISENIILNIRKDNVIEEFDGYFSKRFIEIVNFDENNIPLLPDGVKVKDYNKTQFVKQADVIMLLYLLSDNYNYKIKESNFWFYSRRTLHKSSLSASIHALLATEIGVLSNAYQFFNVALRADISNLHGNTQGGIHAASLGGVWQCVVNGFAGIKIENHILTINPKMPKSWRKIICSISWKNNILKIETKNEEVKITAESPDDKIIKIKIFNKNQPLKTNNEYIFKKQKITLQQEYY